MTLYEKIILKEEKISLIGLGYVGMPIAFAFSKKADVIGFDTNKEKINYYKNGIDLTGEIGNDGLAKCNIDFTFDETRLKEAKFHIVAVPTPVNPDHTPDLTPIENSSRLLGRNLIKGSIVVYESTVYPGVTEEICIPILEKESGLKCGIDFKIGYSPERINPGDKIHTLETIVKIVSGMDEESLDIIAKVYKLIIEAGVHRAESIKIAEAAKVIENSQRDINIAFMNELSMIFNTMGIDTDSVLKAAGTKWNFLNFRPGLVGGHCIGVDPYYLVHKAEQFGYHSQVILSGRKVNDDMGKIIAENTIKQMILAGKTVLDTKVAIFGITFKENYPDIRNSRVYDIIKYLNDYKINTFVVDPVANKNDVKREYNIELSQLNEITDMDCIILAVEHDQFKKMSLFEIDTFFSNCRNCEKVIIDVKSILDKKAIKEAGYSYWRL